MNDIVPQQALARAMRLWWLIAICVFLGGAAAWTFTRFHAPVYEATAFYRVSVDNVELASRLGVDPQTQLGFSVTGPYINPVAEAFYQDETQNELFAAAGSLGIPAQAVDFNSKNLILDRNGSTWYITVRNEDPQLAARLANLWLQVVDVRVREMLVHAYSAESLETVRAAVMQCYTSMDFAKANECAGTAFKTPAEFESYLGDLDRQAAAERLASGGLDTVVRVVLDRPAVAPAEPVLYQQGTLILAGSLAGFLIGLGVLQFGFPGSKPRDRK